MSLKRVFFWMVLSWLPLGLAFGLACTVLGNEQPGLRFWHAVWCCGAAAGFGACIVVRLWTLFERGALASERARRLEVERGDG